LNTLFVPVPADENIQLRSCQIYGTMGSGKTSLYRYIAKKAIERYGIENVNPMISTSLDYLIESMDDKPVQLLCMDDSGLEGQEASKALINKFTVVRHTFAERRKNGVIIVLFAVQDYFLLSKKIRSTLHVEILKHAPTNAYDISKLKASFGEEAIQHLLHINKQAFELHNYKVLSSCIARTMSKIGYFNYEFIPSSESQLINIGEGKSTVLALESEDTLLQDKSFFEILQHFATKISKNKRDTEPWYYEALNMKYFSEQHHTWKEIAETLNDKYEQDLRSDSYRVGVKKLVDSLDNTSLGNILEFALLRFLNNRLSEFNLQQTFRRLSGSDRPDLLFSDDQLAINCKLYLDNRPSWTVLCTPEYEFPDCWVAFFSPESGLVMYHNEDHEKKPTLKVRKNRNVCSVEDFISYVVEKVKKNV